ncbi:putative ribosomal protein l34 [Rosellinia necatrix]|uniref:Putative ribosomal protein l34 n=1 Tax=Rosellinia necatrix TaxID=77044 RepID=A0A1W2THK8_ROSNE|nr:putative ribosomal protein l34 [Rosellinia necatrix]
MLFSNLTSPTPRAALSLSRVCKSITAAPTAPTAPTATRALATRRTFTSLPHLRPSALASNSSVFRPSNSGNTLLSRLPSTTTLPAGIANGSEGVLDIVPKLAITAHPAFAGPQQVRCGPRPTMARSSRLVRKRRHGFLSRLRTRNGQRTLQRRKDKKRSVLSM